MSFTMHADATSAANVGFNGELHEHAERWQILGNGYRIYNPTLLHFHSPDNLSPFDDGGINAYSYCGCDPVNFADPTGHLLQWVALGAAVGAVAAGVGGLVAASTDNDALASRLGQVAMGLGIAAAVALLGAGGGVAMRRHRDRSASAVDPQVEAVRSWGDDAPKLAFREDRIVLQTHSGPFANVVIKKGRLTWVSAGEQARLVKATVSRSDWGKPVQVVSCFPGYGKNASSAQRFADVWEGPVLASRRDVFSDEMGRVNYVKKDWSVFTPQKGLSKGFTAVAHGALSVPGALRMRALVALNRWRSDRAERIRRFNSR